MAETLGSSVEMTEQALVELGLGSGAARVAMKKFRSHDERMLIEQHKVHRDQEKLIEMAKYGAQLLSELLEGDRDDVGERVHDVHF